MINKIQFIRDRNDDKNGTVTVFVTEVFVFGVLVYRNERECGF